MTQRSASSLASPDSLPTVGQLERSLGQAFQFNYARWTGHSPSQVICHLAGQVINVLIRDSITPFEALLDDVQAAPVRSHANGNMRSLIASLASEICNIDVESVMLDSNHETGLTGIIILLRKKPPVRARKRKSGA